MQYLDYESNISHYVEINVMPSAIESDLIITAILISRHLGNPWKEKHGQIYIYRYFPDSAGLKIEFSDFRF